MTKPDRIIADLMNALDMIARKALEPPSEAVIPYIIGVATQAAKNCNAQRERNADGYLVVKGQ